MRSTAIGLAIAVLAAASSGALAQSRAYTTTELQMALKSGGYDPGPIDGSIGPSTRRAIEAYQRDAGLPLTGGPDAQLVLSLERQGLLGGQQAAAQGDPLVADTQTALRKRGYAISQTDGVLDSETRAAVRDFQRQQGLPATGQPSPELLALMETGGTRTTAMGDARLVAEVERQLHNKGYQVGPINSTVEPQTQAAIRQYQQQRGFQATGTVSEQLLADLRASNVRADQAAQLPRTPEEAAQRVLRDLGEQLER
jgi:peptidoglycan hydrolase-like protein with peptidoglycan-binding domain